MFICVVFRNYKFHGVQTLSYNNKQIICNQFAVHMIENNSIHCIPKCLHISWNGNYSDTLISCFHIFGLSCELKKKFLIMQIRHILIFLPIVQSLFLQFMLQTKECYNKVVLFLAQNFNNYKAKLNYKCHYNWKFKYIIRSPWN